MTDKKTANKASDTLATFEEEADKFVPYEHCGTLLRAKRELKKLMRLTDIQSATLEEGEAIMTLYDFVEPTTKERALIFLVGEARYMYMTTEFDEDFEVLSPGTQQMMAGGRLLGSGPLGELLDELGDDE